MKLVLAIALGGAIGAVARYHSVGMITRLAGNGFPYATLFVNAAGSFLAGVAVALLADRLAVGPELRGFLVVGVLGAFTTFSSFSLDFLALTERSELVLAGLYVVLSVTLSIGGLFCGLWLTRGLVP